MSPSFLRAFAACVVLSVFVAPCVAEDEDFSRLDESRWSIRYPGPGAATQLLQKEFVLLNRPYLLSKQEWPGGEISFQWKPSVLVKGDDDRTYGDHIAVLFFSDGSIREVRSYEPLTGIVVRIDSVTGDCYIQQAINGPELFENLIHFKGVEPIDPEAWHTVKVTCGGKTVAVDLDGKPVAKAELPANARKGKMWGLYNREAVGPGQRMSLIRSLSWTTKGSKAELLNIDP